MSDAMTYGEIRRLTAALSRLREGVAQAMSCENEDDDDLIEAVRLLVSERDEARAQLAALREAVVALRATQAPRSGRPDLRAALDAALTDTAAAAEAHDRRLREAGCDDAMADFTRERVYEAERDRALREIERRDREHAALLETAQKALAYAEGKGNP